MHFLCGKRYGFYVCNMITKELYMSQTIAVNVPDIGDFKDIPVIEVLVKPGDTVTAEQSLITLETDKATMDVPAPVAGVVKELKVKSGRQG